MRRISSTKRPSYLWLKALIIASIVASAYLLITKQYFVLIEIIVCIIIGIISYKVIKHQLENPKSRKIVEQSTEQQSDDSEFNIRKLPTKELIEELARRGEIR